MKTKIIAKKLFLQWKMELVVQPTWCDHPCTFKFLIAHQLVPRQQRVILCHYMHSRKS